MPNPFVHVELNAADTAKAKDFYGKLFQWRFEDLPASAAPEGPYTSIRVGTGTGGGIMTQVPGGPSGWLPYVEVDDIRTATQQVSLLGGKVMKDVTEVPNMGWLSIIQDPNGAMLGLWQTKSL